MSKRKGDYVELKAKKKLESEGYLVEKAVRSKWQRKDFYNAWDLIAIHPDGTIRFIQVSSQPLYDRGRPYQNKLLAFPAHPKWTREYWWYKEGGWQIKTL